MNSEERVDAFGQLGKWLTTLPEAQIDEICTTASLRNPWFTPANVRLALKGVASLLETNKLKEWLCGYDLRQDSKHVGVVMAGNIPLVGFHDALCVLISGHILNAKLSSQDSQLLPLLLKQLVTFEPRFEGQFTFEERLNNIDAAIATGSDNTARYFEYYFKKMPHIIRKNRSSCAVIMGEEPDESLTELGRDVFSYFGLGCRNVSKVYIPQGYEVSRLLKAWEAFADVKNQHKYTNNYDYQKSILLVNQVPHFDNGIVLLTEHAGLVSPIAVVYYQVYQDQQELQEMLRMQAEKLQCIVSADGWYPGSVAFGQAQLPGLSDYADHIDTMEFLSSL